MKVGPGHLPVFKCLVEVAGKVFAREPAKTKKQAEKNAAMAAWSVIKQWAQPPAITSSVDAVCNDGERSNSSNALALYRREDNSSQTQPAQRRYGGRSMGVYQRSPSWFDSDTPHQDPFANSRANCGNMGRVLPLPWHYQPQQQGLSRLSLQSHSDRFELRRPLMEELELEPLHKEGDDDWLIGGLSRVDSMTPHSILTPSIFEDGMYSLHIQAPMK
ncbi:hypothetical protein L7F22_066806 [Adiantum nelumboides]|nr:hypothetical protein [Adiantum nelumboides]